MTTLIDVPALDVPSPPPESLPTATVGREQEVAEILELLAAPNTWGVLLHGGPGIGKTRLARTAALAAPGGSLVLDATRHADAVEALAGLLADLAPAGDEPSARPVLVLDGLDHLSTPTRSRLLALARDGAARSIVTLRRPVEIDGLHPYLVTALPVALDCSALDLDSFARIPSVRLFTDRVQDLHPGFRVDHDNQHVIARICAELRGVPGGLCRAARVAGLEGLDEVFATEFDTAFDTASGTVIDTVFGTVFDTVYDRQEGRAGGLAVVVGSPDSGTHGAPPATGLGEPELRLLGHAPVFTGGFGTEALRTVARVDRADFPDALETLVNRHLLTLSALPSGHVRGVAGVRLHLPADPAVAAAARSDLAGARRAHAEYYAKLAGESAERIAGGNQRTGIAAFHSEERNLAAAFETLLAEGDTDRAVGLLDRMCRYWRATGTPFGWAERQALLPRPLLDGDEARINLLLAEARAVAGEPEAARALIEMAEVAAEGDLGHSGRLLHVKGLAAFQRDRLAGIEWLRQALARRREEGDPYEVVQVLLDLSMAHFVNEDLTAGTELAQEALSRAVQRNDLLSSGTALLQLSAYSSAADRPSDAEQYFPRAMANLRGLGGVAVLGAFIRVVGSPLRAGVSGRVRSMVRLLGSFYATRERTLGTPTEPDFAVSRLEQRLRRQLDNHDFIEALRDGARTELAEQVMGLGAQEAVDRTGTRAVSLHGSTTHGTGGGARPAGGLDGVLTARQSEVCVLLTEGLSNKQIARRMEISEWTVVNHMREIMRKLGCTSRIGVVGWVHDQRSRAARAG